MLNISVYRILLVFLTSLTMFGSASCGSSDSAGPTVPSKIFVTAGSFTGDLVTEEGSGKANGILAADALCMSDANYPGTGTYKALIVDGANRVASVTANAGDGQVDWVLKPNTNYSRSDGTTLIMTTDANAIFVFGTLNNGFENTHHPYWSGLNDDWTATPDTPFDQHCNGWAYGGATAPYGVFGYTDGTDSTAIHWSGSAYCSNIMNLVCVQQ